MLIYLLIWLVLGLLGTTIATYFTREDIGYIEFRYLIMYILLAVLGPIWLLTAIVITLIYLFENTLLGEKKLFIKKEKDNE